VSLLGIHAADDSNDLLGAGVLGNVCLADHTHQLVPVDHEHAEQLAETFAALLAPDARPSSHGWTA
jgi:hypothetical protein